MQSTGAREGKALKTRTQRPGPCALRCRRQPAPLVVQGAAVFNALTGRRARRRSVRRVQKWGRGGGSEGGGRGIGGIP